MSLANYFVRASEPQTHSDGIIGGLSTTQEAKLQRLNDQLQLSDRAPDTSTSAFTTPSSPNRMSLMTRYFPDEIDEHGTFSEIGDIVDGAIPHDEYIVEEIQTALSLEFSEDVIAVDDFFDYPVGLVDGASDFMDPHISIDFLLGFVSRFDDVHDSSFMDLSIFKYFLVPYDITLSAPSSPTSQLFDIDDEIAQHDLDDDWSSASDSDPID
ncbi:hypothetical protein CK203_063223 [Vitis vinifera]|uniref:Uncharacterized protein n=1 Tax=Vitis vinifera TaxID=29760 RepID=A0A438FSX1_VITVI|nr:hypothetical protein CK203_063223 [Vitis vinifera]